MNETKLSESDVSHCNKISGKVYGLHENSVCGVTQTLSFYGST
jgi:hypothetical protein